MFLDYFEQTERFIYKITMVYYYNWNWIHMKMDVCLIVSWWLANYVNLIYLSYFKATNDIDSYMSHNDWQITTYICVQWIII